MHEHPYWERAHWWKKLALFGPLTVVIVGGIVIRSVHSEPFPSTPKTTLTPPPPSVPHKERPSKVPSSLVPTLPTKARAHKEALAYTHAAQYFAFNPIPNPRFPAMAPGQVFVSQNQVTAAGVTPSGPSGADQYYPQAGAYGLAFPAIPITERIRGDQPGQPGTIPASHPGVPLLVFLGNPYLSTMTGVMRAEDVRLLPWAKAHHVLVVFVDDQLVAPFVRPQVPGAVSSIPPAPNFGINLPQEQAILRHMDEVTGFPVSRTFILLPEYRALTLHYYLDGGILSNPSGAYIAISASGVVTWAATGYAQPSLGTLKRWLARVHTPEAQFAHGRIGGRHVR